MKTLLVSEEENAVKNISQYLQSIGSEMICYHNVLKALDNIDEISPHLVIVDAESFPRLWKVFVQFIICDPKFEKTLFVLISKNEQSDDEQEKMEQLGIKRMISSDLSETDKKVLYNLLTQNNLISERDATTFIFSHPVSDVIITGQIISMFSSVIIFEPEKKELTKDIKPGTIIKSCTLKIGQAVTEPIVKVLKNDSSIQFQIL